MAGSAEAADLFTDVRGIVTYEKVTPATLYANQTATYNALVRTEYGDPLPSDFTASPFMD